MIIYWASTDIVATARNEHAGTETQFTYNVWGQAVVQNIILRFDELFASCIVFEHSSYIHKQSNICILTNI